MIIYDFTVKDTKGNDVSLSDYKGKVPLIVNTAKNVDLLRSMRLWKIYMKNSMIKDLRYWTFHVISSHFMPLEILKP